MASSQYDLYKLLKNPRLPADVRRKIFFTLPYKHILIICRDYPHAAIGVCDNKNFWYEYTRRTFNKSRSEFDSLELPAYLWYAYYQIIEDTRDKIRREYFDIYDAIEGSFRLGLLPLVKKFLTKLLHETSLIIQQSNDPADTLSKFAWKASLFLNDIIRKYEDEGNIDSFIYLYENLRPYIIYSSGYETFNPVSKALQWGRFNILDYLLKRENIPVNRIYIYVPDVINIIRFLNYRKNKASMLK